MLKINSIGDVVVNDGVTVIALNKGMETACMKLNLFSHCLIFSKDETYIHCNVHKIVHIDEKKGHIQVSSDYEIFELIDIKPYFPCEDIVDLDEGELTKVNQNRYPRNITCYTGENIGTYVFRNHKQYLKVNLDNVGNDQLEMIKNRMFIRVIWWFHRFDKADFRRTRVCQPPYNDAPKTGVFATRSPVRPNPIASTIVKVNSVDVVNGYIEVEGFDGFENSPFIQLMGYSKEDIVSDVSVPSWVANWRDHKIFVMPKKIEMSVGTGTLFEDENKYYEEIELNSEDNELVNYNEIAITKASINNLKEISVTIPKEEITMITGVSGSGKSSLAFDTIYAKSQQQFMDLVSSNSVAAMDMQDIQVEKITGLQPSIAIEQRNLGLNPRSTVGTVSKIAEFVKLLFVTVGERVCPNCHHQLGNQHVCSGCGTTVFELAPQQFNYNHPEYMCPVCKGLGVEITIDEDKIVEFPNLSILDGASTFWGNMRKHREKPNANWMRGEVLALAMDMGIDMDVPFRDLPENFRHQLLHGSEGRIVSLRYKNSTGRSGTITRPVEGAVNAIHRFLKDSSSDKSSIHIDKYLKKTTCSRCHGERLLEDSRLVHIRGTRYPEVMNLNLRNLRIWCHETYGKLPHEEQEKVQPIFRKLLFKLKKIRDVGLNYITLNRSIPSLSGGEAQRLKIATQFGSGLTNILYIMDEPSKGLHPKDYQFLLRTIDDLKKLNNTVIMVEHKEEFLQIADNHIVIGPRAGKYGGEIVSVEKLKENVKILEEVRRSSIDPKEYNQGHYKIDIEVYNIQETIIRNETPHIEIHGAKTNNLKNINVKLPLNQIVSVIGVSGSGKSSLVSKTLYPSLMNIFNLKCDIDCVYDKLVSYGNLQEVHLVNQKAIGKNSRSNPATYTGVFDLIRQLYAKTELAKTKKFGKEHFSFNSKKGQCSECNGMGQIQVPMHFMEDIYIPCTKCHGTRYRAEILEVKVNNKSIADILELEIKEVIEVFREHTKIYKILKVLDDIGLGYIRLGQSAATLSGGEAQRIKLAKELAIGRTENVLFILDEPTTGLHQEDVARLIQVLQILKAKGASIIIVEHNEQIIRASDWVIEMGPSGGDLGGKLLRSGKLVK